MEGTENPKSPQTLSRDELYALVWKTPMSRLAEQFGISGNGLAKICRRLNVPYPPRGHWAKQAAGKKVAATPLSPPIPGAPSMVQVHPSSHDSVPAVAPEVEVVRQKAAAKAASIVVPERLTRPHPIIADWLADYEKRAKEARRERDPWTRDLMMPAPFTDQDRRRHRILHVLFKELERQGAFVKAGEYKKLFVTVEGEEIEIELREKLRQVRRPLNDREKQFETWNKTGTRQELQPSGFLLFSIKTYLAGTLRREWLEKPSSRVEDMLPDIVSTLMAAGPVLAERKRKEAEAARLRAIEQQRLQEERDRQRQEHNRWRRLTEIAVQWKEVSAVREFLSGLKNAGTSDEAIKGKAISEWVRWAEDRLEAADPLRAGPSSVFKDIAEIGPWSYRD